MVEDMSPDAVVERARALQTPKEEALRVLAVAHVERERARAAAAQAEAGVVRAWQGAQQTGWSESELRRVGFVAPGRRAPGRPRGSGRRPQPAAPVEEPAE